MYQKLNTALALLAGWLRSPFLLLIRLYWGWQFVLSGWGKFHRLDQVAGYFGNDLHIPMPKLNAILASSTELVGGILLLLGLGGRIVPLPLIFCMIVAYSTAERENLHAIFSDPDKFVTATPFLFLLAAVIIFVFGPGRLSIDALLNKKASSNGE